MTEQAERPTVSPHLTVKGASEAIEFYQEVFGANLAGKMMAEDGNRIMHATLEIRGGIIMLSDEFPEFSPFRGPATDPISPVAISLRLDKPEYVDAVYEAAISNGAKKSWAPEDMFWGDRYAQLIDPWNHRWMLVAVNPSQG